MSMIDFTIPTGILNVHATQAAVAEMSSVLLKAEGSPDTAAFRDLTWVYIHEISTAALAVGGRVHGPPRFRIEVTVPEGALNPERKSTLIADIHEIVCRVADIDPGGERSLHVWTIVREVPEGDWGVGGVPLPLEEMRALAEDT